MMELLDRLAARADLFAEQRRRIVEAAWTRLPGVTVGREGDRVMLAGPGLVRRWLGDVAVRFAGRSDR